MQAQISKTINCSAGNLYSAFSTNEIHTVTNLIVTGEMNALDFYTIRDSMNMLSVLDLSGISIAELKLVSIYTLTFDANSIPPEAFKNCSKITSIILPLNLINIDGNAFDGCTNLTSLNIPDSVQAIQFGNYPGLINVSTNNPYISCIDNVLFNKNQTVLYSCSKFKTGSYSIPQTVTYIDFSAFENCKYLTSVTIPTSVDTVRLYAFNGCLGLNSITIPASVKYITGGSLENCGLINVDSNNPNYSSLDGALFNKTKTTLLRCNITLGNEYIIPSTVDTIGGFAFENDSTLNTVTIPSSVNFIEDYAFSGSKISKLYSNIETPENKVFNKPFSSGIDLIKCVLYIPYGLTTFKYDIIKNWNNFKNIVEMNGFMLSDTILSLNSDSGSTNTTLIKSNITISVTSNQSWLKVNPSSNIGNSILNFYAQANLSGEREAKVSIAALGVPNKIITIKQKPYTFNCTDSMITLNSSVSNYKIEINPNSLLNVVSTVSWLTANMIGDSVILLSAEENFGPNRNTIVTVSNGISLQKIYVSQKAKNSTLVDENFSNLFSIYPNPTINSFKINVDNHAYVSIYDITGILVLKTEIANGNDYIYVPHLISGSYLVKVITNDRIDSKSLIIK